jgi:hypothetical protein
VRTPGLAIITVFTRSRHWSIFWASWIQPTPSNCIFQN